MDYISDYDDAASSSSSHFERSFICYAASFVGRPELDSSDKIIMPESALHTLSYLPTMEDLQQPMLFQLQNPANGRVSHCGVLEFVAEEDCIYMPGWMMQHNLLLNNGDVVEVSNASLPKASYVKLQPHSKDFLDISNPRSVLEVSLRKYSCLSTGDTILVPYNERSYYINILETRPGPAVSIVETDCDVDFAPPLDYQQQEPPKRKQNAEALVSADEPKISAASSTAAAAEQAHGFKFKAFTGVGRRLDGKPPLKQSVEAITSSSSNANSNSESKVSEAAVPRRKAGKLVFGAEAGAARSCSTASTVSKSKESEAAVQDVVTNDEPPVFKAFSGRSYTLKD